MLILAVLCAVFVGHLTGGRLSRYEGANLTWLWLPVAALVIQEVLLPRLTAFHGLLVPLSYALILLFLWKNRRLRKTALLCGLGWGCNTLVICANGFRMPVAAWAVSYLSPEGAARLAAGEIPMYTLAGENTRLLFLGDILYCPLPLLSGFASVGDLLLAAGVFFCLLRVMDPVRLPRWLKSG